MTSIFRPAAGLVALGLLIAAPAVSLADNPGGPGSGPPAAGAHHGDWAKRREAHEAEHARRLHDILNIQPGQEQAFQAFLAAMRPPEGDRHGGWGHEDMGHERDAHLTTPERLDRMAARMAEHQAAFAKRAEAVKAFYAVLTPAQQKAFDAVAETMGPGHRHHGWGFGGHHGPGGPGGPGGPPPEGGFGPPPGPGGAN